MYLPSKQLVSLGWLVVATSLQGVVLDLDLSIADGATTISLQQPEDSVGDWHFYEPRGGLIRSRVELWVPVGFSVIVESTYEGWTYHQNEVESNGSTFDLTTWYYEGTGDDASNEYDYFPFSGESWASSFKVLDSSGEAVASATTASELQIYATILNASNSLMSPIAAIQLEDFEAAVIPEAKSSRWAFVFTVGIALTRRRRGVNDSQPDSQGV
ncbi:MAG: hypothetical protein ACSHYA_07900 [Opitutaceae bacterium]